MEWFTKNVVIDGQNKITEYAKEIDNNLNTKIDIINTQVNNILTGYNIPDEAITINKISSNINMDSKLLENTINGNKIMNETITIEKINSWLLTIFGTGFIADNWINADKIVYNINLNWK